MDKTQKAKNLINDDFFKGEIESLKNIEMQKIIHSQPHQVDEREVAYMKINALQSVIGHFESLAATKQIAEKKWKIL
jgi:hypothetical protein